MTSSDEISIVLQLENRNVTPYIERLWVMTNLCYCSILQTVYSRCLKQRTRPIYHHTDWAAELRSLGSGTSFQAHSSDFVARLDNRYQRDVFRISSNTETFICPDQTIQQQSRHGDIPARSSASNTENMDSLWNSATTQNSHYSNIFNVWCYVPIL